MAITQVTGTTNNGWDFVAGLNNNAFTNFAKNFILQSFNLSIDGNDYTITTSPNKAIAEILTPTSSSSPVSVTLQLNGEPVGAGSSFSGTTTVTFDISQMAFNKVTNKDYLQVNSSTESYLTSTTTSVDSINSTTGFTMEAWVKTTTKGSIQNIIAYGSGSDWSPIFGLSADNELQLSWYESDDQHLQTSTGVSSSNLWDGNWHHVAVSVTSTKATFYLDGLERGSTTISTALANSSTIFNIGGIAEHLWSFNGNLTDIRVWKVTRSSTEIQQYMNVDIASSGDTSNLLELWNFTGDPSNPVNQAGDAQVGTLNGNSSVIPNQTASTTYVNFLTTDATTLGLGVESDLNVNNQEDKDLETKFNTSLTSFLEQNIFPYAQQVSFNLNFGFFTNLINPTHWNFTTVSYTNSNKVSSNQLFALSMFSNTVAPSTENQNSVFSSDSQLLSPPDSNSGDNLVASFFDYRILKGIENLLVNRANLFSDDDFNLSQSDNPVTLKLAQTINVLRLFFLRLSVFSFLINSEGINFKTSLCTPIIVFKNLQVTLTGKAQSKTSTLYQNVNFTAQFIDNSSFSPGWFFWVYAVILPLDTGFFVFFLIFKFLKLDREYSLAIAIGLALLALTLVAVLFIYYYVYKKYLVNKQIVITPSRFLVTFFTLFIAWEIFSLLMKSQRIINNYLAISIALSLLIALFLGFFFFKWIYDNAADVAYKAIKDRVNKFEQSIPFTNPNFTITNIIYNQAAIIWGIYGSAAVNMTLENITNNTGQTIYSDTECTLKIQLINSSGESIKLSNTGNKTIVTISMPSFLANNAATMEAMNISLTGWDYTPPSSDNGYVLQLTLNSQGPTYWKSGSGNDNPITFEITNVKSPLTTKNTVGIVNITVDNTSSPNELKLSSSLTNRSGTPPQTYTISWTITQGTDDELATIDLDSLASNCKATGPLSGTCDVQSQSNEFITIGHTTLPVSAQDQSGEVDYWLGYQFPSTGLKASWAQGPDETIKNTWSGVAILPEDSDQSTSYYKGKPKGGANSFIEINFENSEDE